MMLSIVLIGLVVAAAALEQPDAMADDARDVFPGVGEYYFNGTPANWTEAYLHCRFTGTRLAVIDSVEEADALLSMMDKYGAASIHIGFHDQFVEGDFITVTGQSVNDIDGFTWAPGAPSFDSAVNCGALTAAGANDVDCGATSVYMCEVLPVPVTPPADYTEVAGHGHYKYYDTGRRWPDADAQCRADGAHLLLISSEPEIDALRVSFGLTPPSFTWVGAHRFFGGNNEFVTVYDEPISSTGYTSWYSGEPVGDFVTNPYVFFTQTSGAAKGLAASPTQTFRAFICEF